MNLIDLTQKPIFFKRNRVKRVYTGGKLFADFLGDEPVDNNLPEEWLASCVRALNLDSIDENEGLSYIENTDTPFRDLIEQYPKETLGDQKDLGILVKYLDSATRLPLQAHPDPSFSRKYFNSNYGKTEMWLILATRENACIYFGFKEEITPEQFQKYIDQSEYDKDIFDTILNKVSVEPGDVFLIPAKAVHAIGYGCLILEVQEPTDFTVQPEHWCDNYKLNEYEMYLGLDPKIALECFDYSIFGEKAISLSKKVPSLITDCNGIKKESLISYNDTSCFCVNRYSIINSQIILNSAPALYIVTKGVGTIEGENYHKKITKGSYFFLPVAANNKYSIHTELDIEFVECLGPQK